MIKHELSCGADLLEGGQRKGSSSKKKKKDSKEEKPNKFSNDSLITSKRTKQGRPSPLARTAEMGGKTFD